MGVSCMRNKDVSFWLFLTPVLIALGLVVVAPLVYGTFYSFTDWNGLTATKFIGFEHYKNLLSDTRFLDSIWFTLKFSVITIFLLNFIGQIGRASCRERVY